jgi:hypothetical protein
MQRRACLYITMHAFPAACPPQDAALDQHGNDSAVVAQVRKGSLWDYVQAAR